MRKNRKGQDNFENATNVRRTPKSEEIMNLGEQPHIPTRGLSTIITHRTDQEGDIFKIGVDELASNRFKKEKSKWGIHHVYY